MCTICRSLTATGSTSSTSTPDSTDVKKRSCSETIETEPQPKKHCPISFIFANSRTDNSTVDVILANLTTFAKLVQQQGFEINVEYDRESDVVIRLTQKSPDGCDMRNVILEVENKVKSIKQEQDKLKCISNEFVTGKFKELEVQMGNETDAQISGLKSIKAADESSEQVHTEVNKNVKRKVSIDGNVVVDEPPCKISRPYSFIFANSKDDKCTVDVIVANLKSFVPLAERNGFELSVTSEFSDGINILLKQSSDTCDTKNVILDVDNEVKRMKDYIKTSQCKNNQFVAYEIAKVQTELCSKLNSFEFSQKSAMDNFQQEVTKQLARVEKQMQTRLDDMTAMQLSFQSEMRDNLQKLTEAVSAKTSAQPIAPESVTNLSLFPHSQTYSPLSLIQQPPARQQLLAHAQQHRPRREPMLPTPRTVPHQPVVLGLPCCPPPSNPHHPLAELARRKVKLEPRDMDSDFGANPLYSRHRNHLFPPVKPL